MTSRVKYLRLYNPSVVGNRSELTIGDSGVIIPFYEAVVTLKAGELNTITLTAPLEALEVSSELLDADITIVGGKMGEQS